MITDTSQQHGNPATQPQRNPDRLVEQRAQRQLRERCAYGYWFRDVTVHYEDGVLILQGRVGSFYLKQLLQTYLRGVEGVQRIDNRVDVISTTGPSSTRPR